MPKRLFKYTSAPSARRILESSTLRYSSPLAFNDIVDVRAGLHFEFDPTSLPERFLERFEELVYSESRPELPANLMGKAILLAWDEKAERGFPREEFRSRLGPVLQDLPSKVLKFQTDVRRTFREELELYRILCMSEVHDDLLMWTHYADSHAGAVLSFRVIPEEDNLLCAAQPVEYRSAPLPLFSEKDWVDWSLQLKEPDYTTLVRRYPLVKSLAYAYEKEWRVCDSLPHAAPGSLSDYPSRNNELEAIYLGYRTAPSEVAESRIQRAVI